VVVARSHVLDSPARLLGRGYKMAGAPFDPGPSLPQSYANSSLRLYRSYSALRPLLLALQRRVHRACEVLPVSGILFVLDGWIKPNTGTHERVAPLHRPGRVELSYVSNSGEFGTIPTTPTLTVTYAP
jgi:hypothetical protein